MKARESEWAVAFRRKIDDAVLLPGKQSFSVIGNTLCYWCADPFVVEDGTSVYIFFEAYDRLKRKGLIGCREIRDGSIGDIHIIIKESHHLSYPCVYRENGHWYLIPETKDSNEITRYRAIEFPYRWEKDKVLIESITAVDSTVVSASGSSLTLMTYIFETYNKGELRIFRYEDDSKRTIAMIRDPDGRKRPAGKIFSIGDTHYRPSQLCTKVYGEAVIINKIVEFTEDSYQEEEYRMIGSNDLSLDINRKITGVHTYNRSENWEVIDVEISGFSLLRSIGLLPRLYFYIARKMRRAWRERIRG